MNVVDFRDRDSIATAFEYDIYPFGVNPSLGTVPATCFGWDVDGNPGTTGPPNNVILRLLRFFWNRRNAAWSGAASGPSY